VEHFFVQACQRLNASIADFVCATRERGLPKMTDITSAL
jgi:hypothetical protein